MITLYHCVSARSFRPLWMLEELGLAYDLKMLPFPPRVHRKEYLETNPLGTIPYFRDGDSEMTESAAICEYLVARYATAPLRVESDDPAFASYLNWLHFGEATLTFPQTLVLRYGRVEPPERQLPQIVEDYARWFLSRLRRVEATVASRDYLSGDRFTAADVSVGYALMLAQQLGLSERFRPGVAAYWQRLQARDGFRRALERERREAIAQGVSAAASSTVTAA